MTPVDVYLELTDKRVFAAAYDWPGWCRSGKTADGALETLSDYASRYAAVGKAAGIQFDPDPGGELHVVERVPGDGTTAFGAPSVVTSRDLDEPSDREKHRILALLGATWEIFDAVVAASPEELRKGPRGGGRDRSKIVGHVLGAESGYSRLLGLKLAQPDPSDTRAVHLHRQALRDGLRDADATCRRDRNKRRWPMRYAARRVAWHILDHAWEIEDRRI